MHQWSPSVCICVSSIFLHTPIILCRFWFMSQGSCAQQDCLLLVPLIIIDINTSISPIGPFLRSGDDRNCSNLMKRNIARSTCLNTWGSGLLITAFCHRGTTCWTLDQDVFSMLAAAGWIIGFSLMKSWEPLSVLIPHLRTPKWGTPRRGLGTPSLNV